MTEPLVYENVTFDETIGPFEYVIPKDYNEKRLTSLSIDNASFLDNGEGKLYAEPSFLCGQHSWVLRKRFSWGGSVHAKCEVEFFKPVLPGGGIQVTAKIVDKYERRGGQYVVFQLVTIDDQEALVSRVKNTMLLNLRKVLEYREKLSGTNQKSEKGEKAAESLDGSQPQIIISFGQNPIERRNILLFFEAEEQIYGMHRCIHNDEEIAKKAGLADIVAPGRYLIGIMNCLFSTIYGEKWIYSAKFSVSFLNNLLPGVVVETQATLPMPQEDQNKGKQRFFNVLCQDNVTGKKLLAGTVSKAVS